MNIEQVREFARMMPGATEDMPYGPSWLIFRVGGKIFLHLRLDLVSPTCAVKLDPDENEQLRERYDSIKPAYHLNKQHWSDLFLDALGDNMVRDLIAKSYWLVFDKLPKHRQEDIKREFPSAFDLRLKIL